MSDKEEDKVCECSGCITDKKVLQHVEKVTREYLDSIKEGLLLQLIGYMMEEKARMEKQEGSIDSIIE